MKKLLFITNGHGEDIVTAVIIKHIKRKGIKIDVLPIVGSGNIFESLKVNIIGDRESLPGGGFSLRNFSFLIKDQPRRSGSGGIAKRSGAPSRAGDGLESVGPAR